MYRIRVVFISNLYQYCVPHAIFLKYFNSYCGHKEKFFLLPIVLWFHKNRFNYYTPIPLLPNITIIEDEREERGNPSSKLYHLWHFTHHSCTWDMLTMYEECNCPSQKSNHKLCINRATNTNRNIKQHQYNLQKPLSRGDNRQTKARPDYVTFTDWDVKISMEIEIWTKRYGFLWLFLITVW